MSKLEPENDARERLAGGSTIARFMNCFPRAKFLLSADGEILHSNDACNRLFGTQASEMRATEWINCFPSVDQRRIHRALKSVAETQQSVQIETVLQREDASQRLVTLHLMTFVDEAGEPCYVCHAEDTTIVRQLSEAAEENERRLAIMLEVMSEGVVLRDAYGQIMMSNPAAEEILGLNNDQLAGRSSVDPCWRSVHEDGSSYPGEDHPAMRSLATGESLHKQAMGIHKPDGTLTWISINSVPLFNGNDKKPYSVVASFSDITELKNARDETQKQLDSLHLVQIELEMRQRELEVMNAQLRGMADTDVLTGLKNRRCLFDRLRAEISLVERNGSEFSFVLIDVDFFKSINDTFGHMAGDAVLKRVAQSLTDCARVSDFVARYGGEEFAVIMPHTNRIKAQVATERMLAEIGRVHWKGKQVTASAGVSTYAGLGSSIDSLIEDADSALYAAKAAGRNQVITAA